jgi:2-polyprenyl-3-methyl-5-hydroxy-6-metoxy-1,4-benzoquinol methylase
MMDKKSLETVNCNYCLSDNYRIKYVKDGYNIVQCNVCDLVYVNPRLTREAITKLYDEDYFTGKGFDESVQYKNEFEENTENTTLMDWDAASIKEMLRKENPNKENFKLLDIGCGMGLFLHKAQKEGFDVEGIELSEYAAEFARSKSLNVKNGTIDSTDLGLEKYDAIVIKEVIEHLPDPMSSLEKIFNSLKKGGLLFITTGNYDCPERLLKGKDWFYFMPEGHLFIFSNKTIGNYLSKAGFKKISVTNQGDLVMNMLLKWNILETDKFKPSNGIKKLLFDSIRGVNHFISSGLRVYAFKQ